MVIWDHIHIDVYVTGPAKIDYLSTKIADLFIFALS